MEENGTNGNGKLWQLAQLAISALLVVVVSGLGWIISGQQEMLQDANDNVIELRANRRADSDSLDRHERELSELQNKYHELDKRIP